MAVDFNAKSFGKWLWSCVMFPVNTVGLLVASAVEKASKGADIIAAFFTGKDNWFGRTLNNNPFFKSIYDSCTKFQNSVFDLTFYGATKPLEEAGKITKKLAAEKTPVVMEKNHLNLTPETIKTTDILTPSGTAFPSSSPKAATAKPVSTPVLGRSSVTPS